MSEDTINFSPTKRKVAQGRGNSTGAARSRSLKVRTNAVKILSEKERIFVEEYLRNGRNGQKAYKVAWSNQTGMKPRQIGTRVTKLLRKEEIVARIEAANLVESKVISKIAEKHAITKERIIEELAKLAFSNPKEVMEWDENGVRVKSSSEMTDAAAASIVDMSMSSTKEGKNVKVKLSDKRAALVDLGKHLGMFKEETNTIGGTAVFIIEK